MTDPRDPAFVHVYPITRRFIDKANASTKRLLDEFDNRISDILKGMEGDHAYWQEDLLQATKPKPRVAMPKGYIPPNA